MVDFERELTMLAQRGDPMGADEMIERVEDSMAGDTVVVVNEQAPPRASRRVRSGVWIMAAAASVVLVVFLYWAIVDSEVYFDSAGSPPGSPEALFPERMATIEAILAARNSGDFEAYRSYFSDEPTFFHSQITSDRDWLPERSLMAAGEIWELTGPCEIRGRSLIGCPVTATNQFMAPAGIEVGMPALLFGFDDEGAIRSLSPNTLDVVGSPQDYLAAFDEWLAQAHPAIHRSFGPRAGEVNSYWGDLPAPEDMPVALEYVGEFLEHSDVYPLSD